MKRRALLFLCGLPVVGLAAAGCAGRTERVERREESHPLMRRARTRKAANDIDGAIALYQEALERRPTLARAHLELGLLFDQPREDFVRAIYHYERYLELRPRAEKRELIEDLTRHARLAFAASLPEQPSGAVQLIAELRRENAALRAELARARGAVRTPQPRPSPASGASARSPEPAPRATTPLRPPAPEPAAPALETYTVQAGDTLTRIAARVYGDAGQWTRIFEANRDVLRDPSSVRPGQQLAIPPAEERNRR